MFQFSALIKLAWNMLSNIFSKVRDVKQMKKIIVIISHCN